MSIKLGRFPILKLSVAVNRASCIKNGRRHDVWWPICVEASGNVRFRLLTSAFWDWESQATVSHVKCAFAAGKYGHIYMKHGFRENNVSCPETKVWKISCWIRSRPRYVFGAGNSNIIPITVPRRNVGIARVLRCSQRCCWRFVSSGMLHRVDW
jgi:hypothetical protein